jgi:sulfur-carrier protein
VIVRVVIPRALAEFAGGQTELSVEGATVREVVASIGAAYPALARRIVDEAGELRRHVNVYVGAEECRRLGGLDAEVPAGVDVSVIGSIAGG